MRNSFILRDVLREITQTLKPLIPRASREAQLLVMAFLNVDELWLISNQKKTIQNVDKLFAWVKRRAENEPLEYITNSVSFYSQEFYIDSAALIPRPETELLIDEVVRHVKDKEEALTFVEVGVGSGIISIVLAQTFKNARFIAVDISQDALVVAKENIKRFGFEARIELRFGSLLECVREKIDYLVSNPPYIENGVALEKNLSYEPQNALFGGKVGDEIIKKLLDEALKRKINLFTCEMGYDQKGRISKYLEDKEYKALKFYKDYSDFDRGFTLKVRN
jgi:release factor glutamine methyltransferase